MILSSLKPVTGTKCCPFSGVSHGSPQYAYLKNNEVKKQTYHALSSNFCVLWLEQSVQSSSVTVVHILVKNETFLNNLEFTTSSTWKAIEVIVFHMYFVKIRIRISKH
jgi:hypothetical protein